ncbi:uncharacterized protein [Parasteatoda tepidariorum]|uniref:uncharacterized protein isoform X1 n=1 Tax=Parasteatoda tepidariorum TaxID=114398 RepID=UPI001C71D4D2|nr:uncharacterized protein LOC107448079 isoform X2 [Parasteatoda tepidariorum]
MMMLSKALWYFFLSCFVCHMVLCDTLLDSGVVQDDRKTDNKEDSSMNGGTVLSNEFSSDTISDSSEESNSLRSTEKMDLSSEENQGSIVTTVSTDESSNSDSHTIESTDTPISITFKTDAKKDMKKKHKLAFKKKDMTSEDEESDSLKFQDHDSEMHSSTMSTDDEMTESVSTVESETESKLIETSEQDSSTELNRDPKHEDISSDSFTTLTSNIEKSEESAVDDDLSKSALGSEKTEHISYTPLAGIEIDMPVMEETTLGPMEAAQTTTSEILTRDDEEHSTASEKTTVNPIDLHHMSKKIIENDSLDIKDEHGLTDEDIFNRVNNSLNIDEEHDHENTTKTTGHQEITSTMPPGVRKQKQMNFDNTEGKCVCNEPKIIFNPSNCVGGRTLSDPKCPCRSICARQAGESCSPEEPCDEEFGLKCNLQTNTCHGSLGIEVLDVSANSARIKWDSSHSELLPQAVVYYSPVFRGLYTEWTKVDGVKPIFKLENLLPGKVYYVKVEEDGKQEISTFKTKENVLGNMPKVLVKQKSQTTLTVVWDDFRLPSYHSEYVLEYKPADESNQSWTKVKTGTQTIVTVTHLEPNTPYNVKVAVWEDDKMELPSEVITAYTADGCVVDNKIYNVGEEYFIECDSRCTCDGNNKTTCSPRCNSPYVKLGSNNADPLCYEKPLSSDPCCVTIRCSNSKYSIETEGVKNKTGDCPEILEGPEAEEKSCLSDCDHDGDCDGNLKCCPSSCGGAVCVQPLMAEDICEHIYCGQNAKCVSEKMSCECADGYTGNPHDFMIGCYLANSTDTVLNGTQSSRSGFHLNLDDKDASEENYTNKTIISEEKSDESESKNELETDNHEPKMPVATEPPFQLDLTSNSNHSMDSLNISANSDVMSNNSAETIINEEENFHFKKPQDVDSRSMVPTEMKSEENSNTEPEGTQMLFDGCEYNNITYDRGVKFEDGCEAYCTCEGRGHVSCVPRCTVLSAGGPTCKEVQDPDDPCCKIMLCSFPGSTEKEQVESLPLKILSALAQNGTAVRVRLALSISQLPSMAGRDSLEVWYRESSDSENDLSQWNKKHLTQKDLTEVQQGVFEFDIHDLIPQTDYYIKVGKENQGTPNLNMAEFSNTVNVKTFAAAVKTVFQGCFHHNQSYALGEVFYQGCEHKCICREKGFIECQDRCEIYIDTVGYEGCDWVPSEEDSCCMIPMCNRRKIPLMPDGRVPFTSAAENLCIVDNTEVYRVGDIWELEDGCKTKICRCTLLGNGNTSIQCQSQCPPLAPNAHIPTARCPHPVLIKPDGPCNCPYVVCNDAPRRIQPPRPQCEFKGQRYDMGQEFHDGCIALCHCGQDLRVNCAAIECPYHFSADITNCLEWDIDPHFFPTPPHCCAPAKCKNDGSCLLNGRKFENFQEIHDELLPCGTRCFCVNGNVTCENTCPPVADVPPVELPCSPNLAFKGYAPGETCCLKWMCKEPLKPNYCMFQGSRYLVSEKWDVQDSNQQKLCSCILAPGEEIPHVDCRGGCPPIPQKFMSPTEQCLRPVIVTPDNPLMCPYALCNNTVGGQEMYNVNVVALNSTAVRVRFSLSNIFVGLIGHAELHFTTDPTLPPNQWHIQKFSRPKRLFDSPNIEYILNALRPNTTYFLQVKIKIDALSGGPESELFKLRMPEEVIVTTTTTVPPMMIIEANPEAHVIDAKTVRISWRNFDLKEKKYIYAMQLKYKLKNEADDKWITTPMIHRDVTSYFLHDLEPAADYIVDVVFMPPKDVPTKIVSGKGVEFRTAKKIKDEYHLQVSVENNKLEEDKSSFQFAGIPEPISKYVHVIKIMYKTSDGEQSYSFKVPKTNHIMLDHLKPGKKYLAQLELYLTNGQTLTSNEVEFITKSAKQPQVNVSETENVISQEDHTNGKQAELLQSNENREDENRAYFIALVVVAVVAAVAGFGFVLLLVILVKRQASAKAPISRTPSESAYDNPTYKTYDTERPEDKVNGQTIQTTQA